MRGEKPYRIGLRDGLADDGKRSEDQLRWANGVERFIDENFQLLFYFYFVNQNLYN